MPRHHLFFRQLTDLQTFTETVGGVSASAITKSGDDKRTFSVDGETFTDFDTAAKRTCDVQFDGCQKKANEPGSKGVLSVSDCDAQKGEFLTSLLLGWVGRDKGSCRCLGGMRANECIGRCNDAQQTARVKDFQSSQPAENIGPDPDFPDFDLVCDA